MMFHNLLLLTMLKSNTHHYLYCLQEGIVFYLYILVEYRYIRDLSLHLELELRLSY